MNELYNVLVAFICGLLAGGAIHSAYIHTLLSGDWHILITNLIKLKTKVIKRAQQGKP